ncbi:hypothetical protein [Hymenobacter nivis]|uniref:hypothetical protein n=1 Tax=Hymenobacter nivis TaxID=1850093 RepID=UPI0013A5A4AF|nr:hypothetical protein [Hymenobacter nivis]
MKDPSKGIVGRNAVVQAAVAPEDGLFLLAKLGDFLKIIGPTHHGYDADNKYV